MREIPHRLKAARESAGLSRIGMARLLSVSSSTIRAAETVSDDVPDIRLPIIYGYSIHTGVEFEHLLLGATRSAQIEFRLFQLQDTLIRSVRATHNQIKEIIK